MAYIPPSSSKYAPPSPFSRAPNKPATAATDTDGWTTVVTSTKNAPKKWGDSALKKPEPTFDELFPSLVPNSSKKNGVTPASSTESLAEKMKRKMAEEQAEAMRKKTEEEDSMKKQNEKNNQDDTDYGMIAQIGRFHNSTAVLRQFDDEDVYQHDRHEEEYYEDTMDRDAYGRNAGGVGYNYEENTEEYYGENDYTGEYDDGNEYDRY
jgi:surface antigen